MIDFEGRRRTLWWSVWNIILANGQASRVAIFTSSNVDRKSSVKVGIFVKPDNYNGSSTCLTMVRSSVSLVVRGRLEEEKPTNKRWMRRPVRQDVFTLFDRLQTSNRYNYSYIGTK